MNPLISPRRDDVFLDQHLYGIRYRLEQTKASSPIGTKTDLKPPDKPPLQPDKNHDRGGEEGKDEDNADNPIEEHHGPRGQSGNCPIK